MAALISFATAACAGHTEDTVGYAGRDLTDMVKISRNKDNKATSIVVAGIPYPWRLYAGQSVDMIDMSVPVYRGVTGGVYNIDVPRDHRNYFQFISGKDKAIIAERHLPVAGGYNFRDLGGYRTTDGRYVKWGMIMRSDDLSAITTEDVEYLESIPVNSIIDFRSAAEIAQAQDKQLSSAKHYELSIAPGNMGDLSRFVKMKSEDVEAVMMEMNEYFVTQDDALDQFKEYFRILQEEGSAPVLFHCTAGKDRTGMAAALTLYALGVPEEIVYKDYMKSNRYLADKFKIYEDKYPELKPLFSVRKDYLATGIERIKKDHGSVENFLRGRLGIDIERLREMYLY